MLLQSWDRLSEPTVNEPDGCHSNGKEVVRLHGDLDQSSSEREKEEDADQAEGHTNTLPHAAQRHVFITIR